MKKTRSTHENGIVDHYFAVYPLEMVFEKEHRTRIILYFEKNLQILSRHEVLTNSSSRQQAHVFACPNHIQHFRMQTEKNMDYQWSLYFPKMEEDGETEEFVEGQKVNLKHGWTDYHTKRHIYHEMHFNFTSIKCRFDFLLIIANNMKDLLTNAQKYFQEKRPLKIQKNIAAMALEMIGLKPPQQIQQENQESQQLQKHQEIKEEEDAEPRKEDIEANISTYPESVHKREGKQKQLFSQILYRHSRQQKQEQVVNNASSESVQQPKVVVAEEFMPKAEEFQLTQQQKQFGEDLQSKIKTMNSDISSFIAIITSDKKIERQTPKTDKNFQEIMMYMSKDPAITRTTSVTMNEKGQVYLPIYRQNKYIALFFALIALMSILFIIQTRSSNTLQFDGIPQIDQNQGDQTSQIYTIQTGEKMERQVRQVQSDIFSLNQDKEVSINQAAEPNQSDETLADTSLNEPISSVETLQARLLKTKTKKKPTKGYPTKSKAKASKRRK